MIKMKQTKIKSKWVQIRHERDLIFDLSHPVKMTGAGFKKIPFPVYFLLFNLKNIVTIC
jgi:hypothetical protein